MKSKKRRTIAGLVVTAFLITYLPQSCHGFAVMTHQAIIDFSWRRILKPHLQKRYPNATDGELESSRAFAYGGGIIQDMGYFPFSNSFYSDLTHYVNVEYRLARVSLAPAAVEDCHCALRWVIAHAKQYNFDTSKLIITGASAGGHLALITGMLTPAAGLDRQCPGSEDLKVAAIINWFGITDVNDLLGGPNRRDFAGLAREPDESRRDYACNDRIAGAEARSLQRSASGHWAHMLQLLYGTDLQSMRPRETEGNRDSHPHRDTFAGHRETF